MSEGSARVALSADELLERGHDWSRYHTYHMSEMQNCPTLKRLRTPYAVRPRKKYEMQVLVYPSHLADHHAIEFGKTLTT